MNMKKFEMKTAIYFGEGALSRLKEITHRKVLVIADPFTATSGMVNLITTPVAASGAQYEVFSDVLPDAPLDKISLGVSKLLEYRPECIVAVGGGSAIDSAKAIREFALKVDNYGDVDLIIIPTTSGTGSEVTSFAVVNDTVAKVKHALVSDSLLASEAILDPELVKSVPPSITANTGMDVLTHAIEACVSVNRNDFASALAEKAIKFISQYLYRAYSNGNDMEAREKMHTASCLAGVAFNSAGLGLVHGMAHQLGAVFHIPHGCANAMLLPHIVEFNSNTGKNISQDEALPSTSIYAYIAGLIGLTDYNEVMSTRALVNWIQFMQREMGVPLTIQELGTVTPDAYFAQIDKMAECALLDACTPGNPRVPTKEDIVKIYTKLWSF
jgi:alcohol dehydrogenase class IV